MNIKTLLNELMDLKNFARGWGLLWRVIIIVAPSEIMFTYVSVKFRRHINFAYEIDTLLAAASLVCAGAILFFGFRAGVIWYCKKNKIGLERANFLAWSIIWKWLALNFLFNIVFVIISLVGFTGIFRFTIDLLIMVLSLAVTIQILGWSFSASINRLTGGFTGEQKKAG